MPLPAAPGAASNTGLDFGTAPSSSLEREAGKEGMRWRDQPGQPLADLTQTCFQVPGAASREHAVPAVSQLLALESMRAMPREAPLPPTAPVFVLETKKGEKKKKKGWKTVSRTKEPAAEQQPRIS